MCAAALCAPSHRTAATGGIYSSAGGAGRPRVRGCVRRDRPGSRARSVAGVTWTCRTAGAQWAGRDGHTSVIDAASAIYVIGGYNQVTEFHDVWVSTDGGARPDSVKGGGRGGTRGVLRGYYGGTRGGT